MKFSLCSTTKKDMKIEQVIDYASSLELDGIEIWDEHIDEYINRNKKGIDRLRELLDLRNIKCVAIAPYFDFLDINRAEDSIKKAVKCIDYATKLNCKIIRTFLGDKASKDLTIEDWDILTVYLQKCMLLAEKNNVFFALETHNYQPADTAESILRILESINSPFLKILFDGFNFYIDKYDMKSAFEKLKPFIVLYHLKNYQWEEQLCVPINKGDVDFTPIIKTLKSEKYEGYLSFEFFCQEQVELIKKSIDWIKIIKV